MAEIRQTLGIDVSQAITAIDNLDRRLASFGRALDNTANKLRTFNTAAQKAFRLGNVTGDLDKAASSTQKVVRGFANFSGAAQSASSASRNAAGGIKQLADASDSALRAANGLGTSGAGGVNRVTQAFRTFGTTAVNAIRNPTQAIGALGSRIQNFANTASKRVGSLTLSFQTLARIISAQAIIRGVNAIAGAFSQATRSAIDFQRTISEIQTISSGGAFRNFDQAAEAVRNISDAFNLPLGDVGEGLYQTISNQIQGAANQINVLEQAAVLAKVGVADLSDTTELLTGAINAFELSANDADSVAATFFKTVELGRTRISELNRSIGQVQTLAAEAGVSLEELSAAFAAITINGLDTAKAGTQIRGILNAIIKPTEELQQVFEAAGFSEGTLAIETIGLAETIQLISDAAGGSEAELGKLIPRIRGITGQMILARNAGAQFENALDQIQRAASEGIEEEFNLIINTDAERVTKAINQLTNALTVDLGQGILKTLAFFLRFEGLIVAVTRTVQFLSPALVIAGVAFGTYAVATGIAAAANSAFVASAIAAVAAINPIILAIAALVAVAAGVFILAEKSGDAAIENARQKVFKANKERLVEARKTRAEILRIEEQGIDDQFRVLTDFVRKEKVELTKRVKEWENTNKQIQRNTEDVLGGILDANQSLVANLNKEADSAAQIQQDSAKRVADVRIQQDDIAFQNQLRGRNDIQKAFLQQQRAEQQAAQASQQLASARSAEDVEAALAALNRAKATAQEAVSSAESSKNRAAITRASAAQLGILDQQIRAEERLQDFQRQNEARLKQEAIDEEARVKQLEDAINNVIDLQSKFDPTNTNIVDRQAAIQEIRDALGEVRRLSVPENQKLKASQLVSFAQFESDLVRAFQVNKAQGIDVNATLSGASLTKLGNDIENTVAEAFRKGINKALEEGVSPNAFNKAIQAQQTATPEGILDAVTGDLNAARDARKEALRDAEQATREAENAKVASEAAAAALERGFTASERGASALRTLATGISESVLRAPGRLAGLDQSTGTFQGRKLLEKLGQEIKDLPLDTLEQSQEEINQTLQSINEKYKIILDSLDFTARRQLSPDIKRINAAIKDVENDIKSRGDDLSTAVDGLENKLGGAETKSGNLSTNLGNSATQGGSLAGSLAAATTTSDRIAQNARTTETAYRNAAASVDDINNSAPGGPQQANAAFGGLIRYFSRGGFAPRGTDTVPAMLTPGEFVVNARSARKFFPQLQAINSGVPPRYYQEGGSVTTVGDINVSVSDSRGGEIRAREIGRAIDREFRRKTSSIRSS